MNHKRLPKFEDCETIERLTGGDYLAVRNLIAYSSTEKGIILKDLSNGESRPVSGGGKGERRPVFSPDGTRLLFLSQQSGQFCVVIYNLQSAELTTIVRSETPVADPIWSPDGSKILFASSISESVSNVAPACNEPIVIENLGYKFDGLGFRTPDNATHLFIVPSDAAHSLRRSPLATTIICIITGFLTAGTSSVSAIVSETGKNTWATTF